MKRKILDDVLRQHPRGPLYHYTNQAGLLGIIRNKEIWATHTQYLNDSREFLHAVRVVHEELLLSAFAHVDESARAVLSEEFGGRPLPDPEESSDEKRAALREMMESVNDPVGLAGINVCVACFSTIRDSLSQWRAYASRGGSASLLMPTFWPNSLRHTDSILLRAYTTATNRMLWSEP